MSTSRQRNSFTKPELSPSSKSAAAAEAITIRRLKREVLGLTRAVDSLKKNSKEWEFLNSKLEVAREELDAVLEDEQLFRSISSTGSEKEAFRARRISEEQSDELMHMIPTPPLTVIPSPHPVASFKVEELEEKLSQQVKYSLEWFEIKKQIDTSTKKFEHATVTATATNNMNYFRSSSTGSIVTPTSRETLKKSPSTGASISERPRPTVMASIKESQNIQCLKDLLDDVPKYSFEWFELKRTIHRRSNKDPKLKNVQRRKSNQMKVKSPTQDVVSQDENETTHYQSQRNYLEQHDSPGSSYSKDAHEVVEDDDVLASLSSSGSEPNLQPEPQEIADALLPGMTGHTSSISDDINADPVVANHEIEQDPKAEAIQNMRRLQNFLERVPKYSREYYQTKKIIRLLQMNN